MRCDTQRTPNFETPLSFDVKMSQCTSRIRGPRLQFIIRTRQRTVRVKAKQGGHVASASILAMIGMAAYPTICAHNAGQLCIRGITLIANKQLGPFSQSFADLVATGCLLCLTLLMPLLSILKSIGSLIIKHQAAKHTDSVASSALSLALSVLLLLSWGHKSAARLLSLLFRLLLLLLLSALNPVFAILLPFILLSSTGEGIIQPKVT
jgi:hypothetical protein